MAVTIQVGSLRNRGGEDERCSLLLYIPVFILVRVQCVHYLLLLCRLMFRSRRMQRTRTAVDTCSLLLAKPMFKPVRMQCVHCCYAGLYSDQ